MARTVSRLRSIRARAERQGLLLLSLLGSFCLPLLGNFCASAAAQLVTVDAGQGTTGVPNGGLVGVNFGNVEVDGALGMYNGRVVGGAGAKAQLSPKWSLTAGDQTINVDIPGNTSFSSSALARGASLTYTPTPATRITLFGGMAGNGYASSNIMFFDPQIPLGALSIDHFLDPQKRLLLFTRALFSNQQTILAGLLYQTKRLQTGFDAGTGSNQPHAEGLLNYKDKQWDIRSGYLYSGNRFQLLTLPQFEIAQEDRENIDIRWQSSKIASLTLGRHQYLEPVASNSSGSPATSSFSSTDTYALGSTDMVGGAFFLHGLGIGANAYESRFKGTYGSAASFLASQKLSKTVYVNENYYLPLHSSHPMPLFVLVATENLNRRLMLSEFATHVNGQWSLNYGGDLKWDRIDVSVGYSTNFAPLAAGNGRFEQSLSVAGHVRLGRWSLGVSSFVEPDGRVLYSYEVKSYYYHPTANGNVHAPSDAPIDFPNFLVAGMVTLEGTGKPVADVPIRIGDVTVYTDETGAFSLRATRKHTYKIRLLLDRQIGAHYYEQVSGPTEVTAGTDEAPGQAQFVVRVNQKKVLSSPKGGIVIGHADATVDGGARSGQNDSQSAPAGTILQTPGHEPSDPTNLRR